jgi:TRAP-type uncharacterized transport system substrate-binding protein
MKALKITLIFIIFLLLPILYILLDRNAHPQTVKIAVGAEGGGYYKDALEYKEELQKDGINLELVITRGSVDAQEKLLNHEVDFAFIQGGTEQPNILALANVEYEPIWIFYNDKRITDLKSLKGKRIAISQKGSGILPVAKELLNLVGINGFNSKLKFLPNNEAVQALENKEIDAMFYIAAPNANLITKLMDIPNIHLMDFKESESYRQFFIQKHEYFHIVKLHKNGFNLRKHIPTKAHTLLATTAILATDKRASDEMVRLMIKVARRVHHHMGIFHDENIFPNVSMLTIKQHPASKYYFRKQSNYYEENYSFWTAQTLNKLQNITLKYVLPFVTIFAFFIEVLVPAYHLYTRRKLNAWYESINRIDTNIENLNLRDLKGHRLRLQSMLSEIRATDDIPAAHMEIFYTLQNQIVNILDDIDKRINLLTLR